MSEDLTQSQWSVLGKAQGSGRVALTRVDSRAVSALVSAGLATTDSETATLTDRGQTLADRAFGSPTSSRKEGDW